ncbi:Peroxisome assembly factor, partial [Globisporangium splendens]
MWVSSFARADAPHGARASAAGALDVSAGRRTDAGSDGGVHVRAHVWGSDRAPRQQQRGDRRTVSHLPKKEDALTLAMTSDMHLLRQIKVVNGSYVCIRAGAAGNTTSSKSHIAKLVLVSADEAYSSVDEEDEEKTEGTHVIGDITLSPLLAFNLGIPLHATTTPHVTTLVSIRAISSKELGLDVDPIASSFRRKHQEQPAPASYATIAPLLVSSLSCRQHALMQQRDGLLNAIRAFFSSAQVVQEGDIFAIPLRESTSTIPANSTVQYAPYKRIDIPSSYAAGGASSKAVVLPPVLGVDTSLVFFRVEKLEGGTKDRIALSVSETTELMQTTSISAQAPDENTIKQFLLRCDESRVSRDALSFETSLPSKALDQLYEILYPSQLCEIPISVLISGARGVGKTTLVHQVAKQLGVFTVEVPFTELTGQSELHLLENVKDQVVKAQALSPCLLYISRFFPIEKDNEEAELRIGAVLAECIRSLSQNQRNIPLIACVEDLNEVPKFIRQCFLYEMQLEAPDQPARREYFHHAAITTKFDNDVDLNEIAQLTAGRTCGELSALVADAGALAVERLLESNEGKSIFESIELGGECDSIEAFDVTITTADLEVAIKSQQAQSSSSKVGNASIPNVKWDDVGGLEDVKEEILDVVQLPIKHPELFASGVRQRSGILLYGPPGTGKTLLAKAIATECNLNFLSVKGPELLNMYIGESEKNVRQVFAKARSCRPCILFFDELDSLAPMRGRGSDSGGVMDRVVSQLLTEIDGLSGSSSGNDQVFVIGATNRPDLLETGLLRPGRFDRLLYLGICNEKAAQMKVVQALTRKFTLAKNVDLDEVVQNIPLNFTGADFYALCSSALAAALKDRVAALDQQIEEINAEDCYSSSPMTVRMLLSRLPPEELKVPVAQEHFLSALQQIVPSVSPAELQHYEKLKAQYSSKQ